MKTEELYDIFEQHPIVTTDSRRCPEGSMFFALKGASFDGNQYAEQALDKGCAVAVVDDPSVAKDNRFIVVEDVLTALQDLASYHRKQWGGPVLQITGTNGKTTTKELTATVLSKKYNVLYTEGNLNNHIGVPLTILRLKKGVHDMAVIETGANHPGEIKDLSHIVNADFGLISNVGRAHLEGFGSFDGVKRTKGELYDNLASRGKQIFINAFDDDLLNMAMERGYEIGKNAIPYIEGRVAAVSPFVQAQWRAEDDMPWHHINTHFIGAYNITNIRAAITMGLRFGVDAADIDDAIGNYQPSNSRSELRKTATNMLIVDAYNANPSSMNAALTNFDLIEATDKMVILGDMRELGEHSAKEHESIVKKLQSMKLSRVWLVGSEFTKVAADGMQTFPDVNAIKEALRMKPITDSTILIKGSNGTKLYELPDCL